MEKVIKKAVTTRNAANDLTNALISYITAIGGYAVRINNAPTYDAKRGIYRSGVVVKGTADIHACINGLHLSIEVKIGKDKQSDAQLITEANVKRAGGVYIIAKELAATIEDIKKATASRQ